LCINSYPYYQDKKERKNKSLPEALKLHKIMGEGGEKMKILFTLSTGQVIEDQTLTYEEAIELFKQEGKYMETPIINPYNGNPDRLFLVKSHIVKIEEDSTEEQEQ